MRIIKKDVFSTVCYLIKQLIKKSYLRRISIRKASALLNPGQEIKLEIGSGPIERQERMGDIRY